jgi:hypothetical protein
MAATTDLYSSDVVPAPRETVGAIAGARAWGNSAPRSVLPVWPLARP